MTEGSVIEARGLKKVFGDLVAVDGVSFDVRRGECFGLLGPNGAGKTTTIRMIYGFSPVTQGELRVLGLDVRRELRRVKYRMGVCQQEDNLDPDLSVEDNLAVFARYFDLPRGRAKERAEKLLGFIGLDHRRRSTVDELSGGMKRRLMVARALINDPDLLILDEPTTGLDPQARHQVWERLEELKAGGLTILLTTHYMEEASRLCDRLVIMDRGRVLVEGEPQRLIREKVGKNVIEITRPTAPIRTLVAEEKLDHEDVGHRLLIYVENGEEMFRRISETCEVDGCLLRMATLEDVFLKLTGRELRE
jgi:lipooligosaccharide transport system ATP-binding protein